MRYSWEEAKDIVCAAYAKLDPELGTLAKRAFDEGWILAKNRGLGNPHTVGGVPVSQSPGSHPFAVTNFNGSTGSVIFVAHELAHVLSNYLAGEKQGVLTFDPSLLVQESFSHFGEALLEDEMLQRAKTPEDKTRLKMVFTAKELDAITIIPFNKFEEELYALIGKKPDASLSYDEINGLFNKSCADLNKMSGEGAEIKDVPLLWQVIMQPPHSASVYPVTKIMAAALHEAYQKDPEGFRKKYREVMEAGGTIGIQQLWDKLLGKNVAEQKSFIDTRLEHLATRAQEIKAELLTLPVIAKPDDPDVTANIEPSPMASSLQANAAPTGSAKGFAHRCFADSRSPKAILESDKAADTGRSWNR